MNDHVVYLHSTTEDPPRPFYVGRGTDTRALDMKKRNKKHVWVQKKFGVSVTVLHRCSYEESFELEQQEIKRHNTYCSSARRDCNNVGCNLTLGGE